ncbi:hypothetical protein [Nocardia yunnanensis]|uniref:hypothetical protein n=1 Tax=Nocardia yunnanensis TaxID=2382165 RepID=UPI0013C49443|nr:hypothetical protein [Nocardia yunnanensis]
MGESQDASGPFEAIAGSVRERYREHLRRATWAISISVLLYVVLAVMMAWMNFSWSIGGRGVVHFRPTVSVANGAAVIAVFATAVIALNVSARGVRALAPETLAAREVEASGGDAADAYARHMVLGQAAFVCGVVAVWVGLASLFGAQSDGEIISGAALFIAGCLIMIMGIDATSGLMEAPQVESGVRRYVAAEDLVRVRALLGWPAKDGSRDDNAAWASWRSAGWWRFIPSGRFWGPTLDVLLVALLATLPVMTLEGVYPSRLGSAHYPTRYGAVLILTLMIGLTLHTTVTWLVRRAFQMAALSAFCTFTLVTIWVVVDFARSAQIRSWVDRLHYFTAVLLAVVIPCALFGRVLRPSYRGLTILPGTGIRTFMQRSIERYARSLERRQISGVSGTPQPPDGETRSWTQRGRERWRRVRVAAGQMTGFERAGD